LHEPFFLDSLNRAVFVQNRSIKAVSENFLGHYIGNVNYLAWPDPSPPDSHPRADALGGAGRHSRGERPLVFSTELARSNRSADDIHYGLINLRTDGDQMMLAQMLEKRRGTDLWDAYVLP
jgi:hypothetical protein